MKKKKLLSIGAILAIIVFPLFAKQNTNLENIVVTAEKVEQSIQEVPISVSVLDEYSILDSSIENTSDISSYIPNLTTMHEGSRDYYTRISIRGISNTGIGDPAVALYIDDISYADLYAFNSPLFDVLRIEVLKGPQGTLYGKNTEAGVIKIITKEPNNSPEGSMALKYGSYNKKEIIGSFNAPIIDDKLFLRFSALKSSRDGYIENLYDNSKIDSQDTTSVRGNFLLKATKNIDINLILGYNKFDDDGGFPMTAVDKSTYMAATGLSSLKDFQSSFSYNGESSSETKTFLLKMKYKQNNYDLISITGYRDMNNESTLDGDFSPAKNYLGFNARDLSSISQEFRLSSKNNTSFKWLVGAYFSHEDIKDKTGYKLDEVYATANGVPLYTEDKMSANLKTEDIAIFTQNTLRFFNDKLGLTAGLRYEKSKREMNNRRHTFGGVNSVAPFNNLEKNNEILLPKLALDYFIKDNIMLYSSFAKGYKAGGFSYAVNDATLSEFDPEIANSYEVGIKSTFRDIGLTLNLAAFYTKVDDYQDRVQINPTTILQQNATQVDIKGFELESIYTLNDEFSINTSFGITNAKYGDYINLMTSENYKDNKVSLVPKYDLNIAFKYRSSLGYFTNFEIQNTGEKYFDRANSKKIESCTIYNLKVGYERDNWDVYLTAKNLTDEEYFLDGFKDPTLGYMGTVGSPREFSLNFNYRF
ncbi:TonB-dependent receptor [Sulfurimonas sp.]|uniref:TonB-dependent receptor n=1 Tax=Sulfurimonas sp. TaxID=2022749 RepID=UPI002B47CD5E|nr:TonB-dependent receptor [Sulfurimonas sp.]